MQKKQTILVVASLLVVVLSVTLAYFTAQIIGKGKDVTINSADLKIIFTDSDGSISGSNIEPGKWDVTKTFTIENKSNETYKYNIVIQNLVNTFVTEGYLQYKITSTNGGYNMTEFKDVPKSSAPKDTILAYSASVDVGVIQTYTVEFIYKNDETVDQSDDMGKTLSGKLFITEGTEDPNKTLYDQILADKSTVLTRTDFSKVLTNDNTKTIYTSAEEGTTVYYFAGNATDNWVKFGKNANNQDLYWRIIRTNSDGSIRLLYHGTSTTATDAYIRKSAFNPTFDDPMYVGYMYGPSGSLENNRTNTNNSTIKTTIDNWYKDNLNTNYGKYLSTAAVYCNDRSVTNGTYSTSSFFYYGAYTRLNTNKTPSYDCASTEDKFTVDSSTGNGKLEYPIALMTADEVSFAGGVYNTNAETWYYKNSANGSSTGSTFWWLLSPSGKYGGGAVFLFSVRGSSYTGYLDVTSPSDDSRGVRPVISLKSCTLYSTGDGSATNPYTILETETGC